MELSDEEVLLSSPDELSTAGGGSETRREVVELLEVDEELKYVL